MEKLDADQNAKLKEIFDILLSAGYFRCRIPGITIFDKIVGGVAWCITCSNFDIDIEFSEDMNLGQKIKIAEKVVATLKQMGCPYNIGAHQFQGLDLKNIFPIVQWLIKFVLETRDIRQDFNRSVSQFEGNKVYSQNDALQAYEAEAFLKADKSRDKRVNKNSKIDGFKLTDPVRAYSGLMEFDDKTARRTYNRLIHYLSGGTTAKGEKGKANLRQTTGRASTARGNVTGANTGTAQFQLPKPGQSSSIQHQQQQGADDDDIDMFIAENENLLADGEINDEEFTARRIDRKNSLIKENLNKYVEKNREHISKNLQNTKEESGGIDFASMIRDENTMFEEKRALLARQIEKTTRDIETVKNNVAQYQEHVASVETKKKEIDKLNKELQEASNVINGKIDNYKQNRSSSSTDISRIAEYIKERNQLKSEKNALKKEIKGQMNRLEEEKAQIEKDWPTYSGPPDEALVHDYTRKKAKYDEKYKLFAQLNQEIAVLQRKIENHPSAIEIAQYQKRMIELLDQMNSEMERYRDQYVKFNTLQDIRATQENNTQLMRSFKEGLQNAGKSKSKKEAFVKDLQQAYTGLQENLQKSASLLVKTKQQKDKVFENYAGALQLEREYFRLLRELQIEFEKNEALNS